MEFSVLLTLAVWTASITNLTSGKGELQTANNFLSLSSYFSACYLISHHSFLPIHIYMYIYVCICIYIYIYIYIYRYFFFFFLGWFATVDALSL